MNELEKFRFTNQQQSPDSSKTHPFSKPKLITKIDRYQYQYPDIKQNSDNYHEGDLGLFGKRR